MNKLLERIVRITPHVLVIVEDRKEADQWMERFDLHERTSTVSPTQSRIVMTSGTTVWICPRARLHTTRGLKFLEVHVLCELDVNHAQILGAHEIGGARTVRWKPGEALEGA